MTRIVRSTGRWCAAIVLGALAVLTTLPVAAQAPPSDQLLPAATKGYISIPNMPALDENWHKTSLQKLIDDPIMKPFRDDLRRQLDEKSTDQDRLLGLRFDDLRDATSGELSLAAIGLTDGTAAGLLMADVKGNRDKAVAALKRANDSLVRDRKAQSSQQTAEGVTLTVYKIPATKDRGARTLVYFTKNEVLCASTNVRVASTILQGWGRKWKTLSTVKEYQAVMKRLTAGAGKTEAHIRWYVEPIDLAEILKNSRDKKPSRGEVDRIKVAKNVGFDAVKAAGGIVTLAAEPFGLLHHTYVYAPPPHEKAMKMIKFINGGDFTPQAWIPAAAVNYVTLRLDPLAAFDNFGYLFDELYGEGEVGVWKDVVDSIKNDPDGPKIDLRAELAAHLGDRISIFADVVTPIGPSSERKVLAIEAKDAEKVATALAKSFQDDPKVKKMTYKDATIYEIIQDEGRAKPAARRRGRKAAKPAAADNGPKLPNSAVAVGHNSLLVSTSVELLKQVLDTPKAAEPLAEDPAYKRFAGSLAKHNAADLCAHIFAHTADDVRVNYELFRQGKIAKSESVLGRVLNRILSEDKEGENRVQRFDGSKLPPFEKVRGYFGPSGASVTAEENGWFIVGGTLTPAEAPATASK